MEGVSGDGVVAGELIAAGVSVVELDRVAFTGGFLAVYVCECQNAVFIGVGAEILNAVTAEPETVSAVAVERHLRTAVIRRNGNGSKLSSIFSRRRFFSSELEGVSGNGVVTGELIAAGVGIMQLDRVAFTGGFLAVYVRESQNTVFIGVGAEIFNAVTAEPETVSTVAVERHLRTAVIRRNRNAFNGRCFSRFFSRCSIFSRCFLCRSSGNICLNGFITVQCPDCLRN